MSNARLSARALAFGYGSTVIGRDVGGRLIAQGTPAEVLTPERRLRRQRRGRAAVARPDRVCADLHSRRLILDQ